VIHRFTPLRHPDLAVHQHGQESVAELGEVLVFLVAHPCLFFCPREDAKPESGVIAQFRSMKVIAVVCRLVMVSVVV